MMREEAEQGVSVARRSFVGLAAGAGAAAASGLAASAGAAAAAGPTGVKHAAPPRAGFQPDDIVMLDAVSLSSAIHTRRVSCVEVMTAYLDHIERINPKVNAIVALQERGGLLEQAGQRDAQLARGESMGALHGFPHAVKDLQAVKGIRTTQGSPIFKDEIPNTEGLMVERLRNAGAIFIGKTNTPEFGLGSHTYNPVYGPTHNAYDQSRSAGGSSGGAGVGLALRMLPVADGSDFGGSLRNPAGWNNVFGFRTSYGCVPSEGHDVWLPSLSVLGPMARTVSDLALLLSVQAGYDARMPLAMEGEGRRFQTRLDRDMKGKRIAWAGDFKGFTPNEPGVLDACRKALRNFASMGCVVEDAIPDHPLEPVWDALKRIRGWQSGGGLLPYYNDAQKRALLKPEAIYEIELGLKQSAQDIIAAFVVRTGWYQTVRKFFERYDYLVMPTSQLFPFPIEEHWPRQIAGVPMTTYHEWMKATFLITMSGCPSLAVPAGFTAGGLPIGLQIVAPHRHELDCLHLAYAYEAAAHEVVGRLPPLLRG